MQRGMIVAAVLLWGMAYAQGADPDQEADRLRADNRVFRAENNLLRAHVESLQKDMAALKAQIAKLKADSVPAAADPSFFGLSGNFPGQEPPATMPATAPAATVKPPPILQALDLIDLEARREQKAKGLTSVQREALRPNGPRGRWIRLSVKIEDVTRAGAMPYPRPQVWGTREIALLRATYVSRRTITILGRRPSRSPSSGAWGGGREMLRRPRIKLPALEIDVRAYMLLDKAAKLRPNTTLMLTGKIMHDERLLATDTTKRRRLILDAVDPPPAAPAPEAKAAPKPAPEEQWRLRLAAALDKALGKLNRKVDGVQYRRLYEKGVEVAKTASGPEISVAWMLNDNLTGGMIRYGGKMDVVKVLKIVHESGLPYVAINVRASFALTDKFGNREETHVVRASYFRATVLRINWEKFDSDNVYDIADSVRLHPTMGR